MNLEEIVELDKKAFLEKVKYFCLEYDRDNGPYPWSSYEGQQVYDYISEKLGVESDLEYWRLLNE